MALADAFFTPSILITLAICLILVSALGLFFIQKLNQQNHKINTMFDLVNTLAQEVSAIKKYDGPPSIPTGGSQNMYPYGENNESEMNLQADSYDVNYNDDTNYNEDSNNVHTIQMIDVSDDEESGDDEESSDDDESTDNDDESDDEESSDDDEESQQQSNLDIENIDEEDMHELQPTTIDNLEEVQVEDSVVPDNDITLLPNLLTDDIEESLVDVPFDDDAGIENIKNLDIVLDYKKASLSKLREIVTNKGIINDASKMKKAELLKLLDTE